jgi:ribonucleoside-triphosphate reductase
MRTKFDYSLCDGGEIILRPFGFCNLSEVVVRSTDTFESLRDKVEIATILGTFQSTLTNFKYIRKQWRTNAEEERLLGVSLTGIMDHPVLNGSGEEFEEGGLSAILSQLRGTSVETNKVWSDSIGINPSVAITTVS